MQKDIHPAYRPVVFRDTSCDKDFVISSSVQTRETATVDGVDYPLVLVDISSASHQVYTGEKRAATAEGRVARFNRKFNLKLSTGKK